MPTHFRRCPSCGKQNIPSTMRCSCGTLLAGVDLTLQEEQTPPIPVSEPVQLAANSDQTITCPYADCGQPNPPESVDCRYCDRPLHATASPVKQGSLFNLPSALSHRYRISEAMPAKRRRSRTAAGSSHCRRGTTGRQDLSSWHSAQNGGPGTHFQSRATAPGRHTRIRCVGRIRL